MTIYLRKDPHETLDYVFARYLQEDIISVNCYPEPDATITIDSCIINPTEMMDENSNAFPAKRLIILWVSGGTVGTISKVRLVYTTDGGRILDTDVVFRIEDGY